MNKTKIEGYWKENNEITLTLSNGKPFTRTLSDKNNYPIPIPNILSQEEAEKIYALILEKEKVARVLYCRGCSTSRITGEMLGNKEFETDEWSWPEDFAKHYVLDHKVKPTDEFLKYIGYEQLR